MELVEATILARGHQPWIDLATRRYHAKLRILNSKGSRKRDEVLQLFEMTVDQKHMDALLKHLRMDPDISEMEVANFGQGRVVGLIRAKGVIMRCIVDSDCFLLHASKGSTTKTEWRVLGTKKSLRYLMTRLVKRRVEYEIRDISEVKRIRRLTLRQEWLLRTAYDRGYFDFPKGINLRALARDLDISGPALFESLKKTERKLLQEHFIGSEALEAH